MIRQIARMLGVAALAAALVGVSLTPSRSEPSPAPTSPGPQAREVPARQLPRVWATAFWTAERVAAAVPRSVAHDAETTRYTVGANVAIGVRSNRRLLVRQGNNTLSALWPENDAVRRATGKILFSMGGQYFTCSGTVVTEAASQRSVVLTAAHCTYDPAFGFAQNWIFVPNFVDGRAPVDFSGSFCAQTTFGCWTAQSMLVSGGFANRPYFDDGASEHDYAFISVGPGGLNGTSQLDRTVPALPIRTGASLGSSTWALGYPVAPPYDGSKLIYSNTPLGRDADNRLRTYQIGSVMTQGSSGGPWLQNYPRSPVIVSLTSYGYDDDPHLQGPMFTSETTAMLGRVTSITGNSFF